MNDLILFLALVGIIQTSSTVYRIMMSLWSYRTEGIWIVPVWQKGKAPWFIEKVVKIKGREK